MNFHRTVLSILLTLVILACPALSQDSLLVQGKVIFQAGNDVLSLREGVDGIIIDTANDLRHAKVTPDFHYIGILRVDSLIVNGEPVAVTDSSQMADLTIASTEFQAAIADLNVRLLLKEFPEFGPGDSLFYDSVSQQYRHLPALWPFYEVWYPDTLRADTVTARLNAIDNVVASPLPVAQEDDGLFGEPNDSLYQAGDWALSPKNGCEGGIGALECWNAVLQSEGKRVKIAVIDEFGVDVTHPDLRHQYLGGGETHLDVGSHANHGTSVACIALGETNNDTGFAGVAPDAVLLPYNWDGNQWFNGQRVESYFQDFSRALSEGADVIELSMGWPLSDQLALSQLPALDSLARRADSLGVVIVCSAGNLGGCCYQGQPIPQRIPSVLSPKVISVGAHEESSYRWYLSMYGTDGNRYPLVLAPGVSVPTTYKNGNGGWSYTNGNGTSYAAPLVAGLVALAKRSGYPHPYHNFRDALKMTADSSCDPNYDTLKSGAGNVDGPAFLGTMCCIGVRGNVDDDPDQNVDIGDLTALIDNLFISFTPLRCTQEANVDGDGGIDIGDLTALLDHLFLSFGSLSNCPLWDVN